MPNYPPKDFQEIFPEATPAGLILIFFSSMVLEKLSIHLRSIERSSAQKMKFSMHDFLSKRDQILSFLRIW